MGTITKIIFGFAIIIGLIGAVMYLKNSFSSFPLFRSGNSQVGNTATGSATTESPSRIVETEDIITLQKAVYEDFNKQEYEQAINSGKVVILNFYANWCPICRAEAPDVEAGLNALDPEKVDAFRVSYKDDQTDADEKALADQFQIPYQHTKVILKNGAVVYKETIQWSKEDTLREVNKVL